jgi:Spy/CpxP family protein refolding chaperone
MKTRLVSSLFLLAFVPVMTMRAEATPRRTSAENGVENSYQKDEGADKQETQNAGSAHPLTEAQKQAIKSILDEVKQKLAPLLLPLAQSVKDIHENMLSEKPDETVSRTLTKKIGDTLAELIAIKIQTNQKIVNLLTPEQKQIVKSELAKREAPTDLFEIIAKVFNIPEK